MLRSFPWSSGHGHEPDLRPGRRSAATWAEHPRGAFVVRVESIHVTTGKHECKDDVIRTKPRWIGGSRSRGGSHDTLRRAQHGCTESTAIETPSKNHATHSSLNEV
jgi:hypothetical protein